MIGDKASHLLFRHFEPSSTLSRATLLIVIPTLLSGPISYTVRSPYTALPLAFAAYWSGLVFFTLAYRLSPFHPLAEYPGPFLAKTSKWWAAYLSGTGDQHRCLKRLHDRYGDVVRIGRNRHLPFETSPLTMRFQAPMSSPFVTLPLSIPYSAKVAYAKVHVGIFHFYPGQLAYLQRLGWEGRPGPPSLIAQRDPVVHMQQRKPWSRAFSSTAMKEYEVIVATRSRQLIGCLENLVSGSDRKEGVALNVGAWLNYFT